MRKIQLIPKALRKKRLSRWKRERKTAMELAQQRHNRIRAAAEARSDMHAKRNAERRERKAALKAGRGA